MMNAASDDDIYSIEKLLPPPAKPPKAKKVVHHTESCPPADRSCNSRQNSSVDHTNRFPAHQRSQSATTHGKVSKHHAAAIRAQSNPIRTSSTSKGFVNSDSRGRTSQSVSSFIDRDSFCTVTFNRCSSEIEMQGLESATSSSLAHGTVLISIMLTSLAAFVCSKLKDPCEDFFLAPNYKCDQIFSVLFSVFNIFSCLYAFTIYFLHLIGQCDYLSWSARRKVSLEVLCTIMMVFALFACEVLLVTRTMALRRPINSFAITSVIFTLISIILYGLRTFLLIREIRMLWAHPSQINPRSGSQMSKDASLQESFQRRESKSMRMSETDSLHSSNPSQSTTTTHQPPKVQRDGSTKKSVTYARDNGMSSIEMDDVFIDNS